MRLVVFLVLLLHSTLADKTTSFSIHHSDVHKIKCDALPYRTINIDRTCYFVIDFNFAPSSSVKRCSDVLSDAKFAQPLNVPDKVWSTLFVEKSSFSRDGDSAGKGKVMCVYESPVIPILATIAPPTTKSFVIDKVMCFRKQISVAKEAIDRPKTIDEYHCKMICAERAECLSYTYADRQCLLFGTKIANSKIQACGAPSRGCEWAKKTTFRDCQENIPQPSIDFFGYAANLELTAATQLPIANITLNDRKACLAGAVVDTVLPDNSHRVQGGDYAGVHWDGKLGSWRLQKTGSYRQTVESLSYYIRSARCYRAEPEKFADTDSCGDTLPTLEITRDDVTGKYVYSSPVKLYGIKRVCAAPDHLYFALDFRPNEHMLYNHESMFVSCVGGTWIWYYQWPYYPSTATIASGTCVRAAT